MKWEERAKRKKTTEHIWRDKFGAIFEFSANCSFQNEEKKKKKQNENGWWALVNDQLNIAYVSMFKSEYERIAAYRFQIIENGLFVQDISYFRFDWAALTHWTGQVEMASSVSIEWYKVQ